MNSLIWLWLYSLLSTACNVDHAKWRPDYGMTVLGDLIPALPQVTVEKFKTLNGGINPNKIEEGAEYKVPYSSEMKINKPAKWSGNCPKTLLLLGEETTQNTPTPSQQPILSTALGATPDHTTTSPTGTHKAGDPSNSKPTGQATDTTRTNTPTAGKVESKTATDTTRTNTPTAGKVESKTATDTTRTNTPTARKVESKTATGSPASESTKAAMWICWPSGDVNDADTASKAIREKAVNDFCKRFKDKPLTEDNEQRHDDLVVAAKLAERSIEKECSGHGGFLQNGCAYVWITKDSKQNKLI